MQLSNINGPSRNICHLLKIIPTTRHLLFIIQAHAMLFGSGDDLVSAQHSLHAIVSSYGSSMSLCHHPTLSFFQSTDWRLLWCWLYIMSDLLVCFDTGSLLATVLDACMPAVNTSDQHSDQHSSYTKAPSPLHKVYNTLISVSDLQTQNDASRNIHMGFPIQSQSPTNLLVVKGMQYAFGVEMSWRRAHHLLLLTTTSSCNTLRFVTHFFFAILWVGPSTLVWVTDHG